MTGGLFDDKGAKPVNLFGPNKKATLTFKDSPSEFKLFDEDVIADLEEKELKKKQEEEAKNELIRKTNKHPVFKIYNAEDELLYVTVSRQFQALMTNDWFVLEPATKMTIEYYPTIIDRDAAKFMAIRDGNPRYNKNNVGDNS